MTNIENQVVYMKFDNAAFERNLGETLRSLDKLSKSLDMKNATRGFDQITASARDFDISNISSGLETISSKFNAVGAIGFSVLQKLTHGLMNFGASLIRTAQTDFLEPIISGGGRRAENIEQAKFQFRGLGIDIEAGMKSALDAVKGTSFGLDEAAKAAAQFGASGIKAGEEMTRVLRSIAGVASMTNTTFSEIADIYTSAAGMGKITGQDLMQFATRGLNAAAAMAKVWGTTEERVRLLASNGVITFEKFADAMDKAFGEHATKANETYSGSLANMRAALSRLGAQFLGTRLEQQRDLFNALTPFIDKAAAALKPFGDAVLAVTRLKVDQQIAFLKNFNFENINKALVIFAASVKPIAAVITHFVSIIRLAFLDIFAPHVFTGIKPAVAGIVKIAEAFRKFAERLKIADPLGKSIRRIFQGIFAVVEIGIHLVKNLVTVFATLFKALFNNTGDSEPLFFFVRLADVLVWLNEFLLNDGRMDKFFKALNRGIELGVGGIRKFISGVISFVGAIAGALYPAIKDIVGAMIDFAKSLNVFEKFGAAIGAVGRFLDRIKDKIVSFGQAFKEGLFPLPGLARVTDMGVRLGHTETRLDRLRVLAGRFAAGWRNLIEAFGDTFEAVGRVAKAFDEVWEYIKNWFKELGSKLAAVMGPGDFNAAIDILNAGLLGGIILILRKFLQGGILQQILGEGLMEQLGGMLDGVTKHLNAMTASVKAGALLKIAGAVALLTASLLVLALMDSDALARALTAMTVAFGELIGTLALLDTIGKGTGGGKLAVLSASMILLAGSLVVMAVAMKLFSMLNEEEIARGLLGITGVLAALTAAMALMPRPTVILSLGLAMGPIATGLVILAGAIKIFATMSWEELAQGLFGLGSALTMLTIAMNTMNPYTILLLGKAMIPLAIGIAILALAIRVLGTMSVAGLAQGLLGLAGVMLILVTAMNSFNPVTILSLGKAMIPLAIAIIILVKAVEMLGSLSWSELLKGLLGLAAVMLILVLAMGSMPPYLPAIGAGLILVAIALRLISGVIADLGAIKLGDLAKALGALAIMLGIIAVTMNMMLLALPGAIALFVVAKALTALAGVIKLLGSMDIKALAIGLGGVAAVLGLLGIASLVLAPAVPAMIALGVALISIGAGFVLLGAGAVLAVTAITKFSKDGVQGIENMIAAFKLVLTAGPDIMKHLVMFIIAYITELAQAMPTLIKAIVVILGHILDGVIELGPKLWGAVRTLVLQALTNLYVLAPAFITVGFHLITKFLEGLKKNIEPITQLAVDIIIKFANKMTENSGRLVDAAGDMIVAFLTEIARRSGEVSEAGVKILEEFLKGIAKATPGLVKSIFDVITKFIEEIGANAGRITTAGKDALVKFLEGLTQNVIEFVDKCWVMLTNFLNALADVIRRRDGELRDAGLNIITAILEGMTGGLSTKADDVVKDFLGLADRMTGGFMGKILASSPSRVFQRIGGYILAGLRLGINDDAGLQHDVVSVAENIVKTFEGTLNSIPDALADMEDFNPTITPVLDLTKVQAGAKGMDKLMSTAAITPSVSLDNARIISASKIGQNGSQETTPSEAPREVKFEQNIFSPTELSTNEIYRKTKSQLAMAKEELSIS